MIDLPDTRHRQPAEYLEAITRIALKLPDELYVMITDGCNLRCHHCWPRAKPVSEAISISVQNFQGLVENFTRLGSHAITITGGEPLSHPECMAIVAHAARQERIDRVCLQTNGALLDADAIARIRMLPQKKIRIQVSLDGARPDTHDRLRGSGSFRKSIEGLRRLKEIGWGSSVAIAFTETASTIDDLPDLLALAEQLEVGQVLSGCLVKEGRARHDFDTQLPRAEQYEALLTRYHHDGKFRERYDRIGKFSAIEWLKGRDYPLDNQCQCMRMPFVTAAGDLYPCNMLPVERWRIAGIFDRPFAQVIADLLARWRDIPGIYRQRADMPACQSCSGGKHCGGGCLGRVPDVKDDCKMPEDRCALRQSVYTWENKR